MVKSTREYRVWEPAEEDALRDGVKKHGLGAWEVIRKDPEYGKLLKGRTGVQLKDKWRNLVKFRHIGIEESKTYKPKHSGPWCKKYQAAALDSERSNCSSPPNNSESCKLSPQTSESFPDVKKEEVVGLPETVNQRLPRRSAARKVLADYDTGSDLEEKSPSEGSRCLLSAKRKRRKASEDRRFGIYDQRRYKCKGVQLDMSGSDSEDSYVVQCVCGATEDDGTMMIECEGCKTWCHVTCLEKRMDSEHGRCTYDFENFLCDHCQAVDSKQQLASSSSVSTDSKHSVKGFGDQAGGEFSSLRLGCGSVEIKRRASNASTCTQSQLQGSGEFDSFPSYVRGCRTIRRRRSCAAWERLLQELPTCGGKCIQRKLGSSLAQKGASSKAPKLPSQQQKRSAPQAGSLLMPLLEQSGNGLLVNSSSSLSFAKAADESLESLVSSRQGREVQQHSGASCDSKLGTLEVGALDLLPKDLPLMQPAAQPLIGGEVPPYWLDDLSDDEQHTSHLHRQLRDYDIPEAPSLSLGCDSLFPLHSSGFPSLEQLMRGPQLELPGTLLSTSSTQPVQPQFLPVSAPPAGSAFEQDQSSALYPHYGSGQSSQSIMQALGVSLWNFPPQVEHTTCTKALANSCLQLLPKKKAAAAEAMAAEAVASSTCKNTDMSEGNVGGLPDLRPTTPDPWLMCMRATTPTPEGLALAGFNTAANSLSDLSASWLVSRHTPPLPEAVPTSQAGTSHLPFECIHAKGRSEDFSDVSQLNFLNLEDYMNQNMDMEGTKNVMK